MKNRIIEVIEIGQPKSLIQRENEPTTELIDTELLVGELNKSLSPFYHMRILFPPSFRKFKQKGRFTVAQNDDGEFFLIEALNEEDSWLFDYVGQTDCYNELTINNPRGLKKKANEGE